MKAKEKKNRNRFTFFTRFPGLIWTLTRSPTYLFTAKIGPKMNRLLPLALTLLATANAKSTYFVDLTHTQDETALGWPSFNPFKLKNVISEYVLQEPKQW